MRAFKGKTHVIITFAVLIWIWRNTALNIDIFMILGAGIGSYLPDMDIKYSKAGKIIPVWLFTKHRGPTHSKFMLKVLTMVASLLINPQFGIGMGLGYGLHLASDSLTKMHLPSWNWYPGKR